MDNQKNQDVTLESQETTISNTPVTATQKQTNYIDKRHLIATIDIVGYVKSLCPEAEVKGDEILVLNPHRQDGSLGSFKICHRGSNRGQFNDFADKDCHGGNIIDFVAYLLDIPFVEALRHANKYHTGLDYVPLRPKEEAPVYAIKMGKKEDDVKIKFVGNHTQKVPLNTKFQGKKPTQSYIYTDEKGNPLIVVNRYQIDDRKAFMCQSHTKEKGWIFKLPNQNRPLYNLHAICSYPDKPILIVEGEKTAETLQACLSDYVVTTTLGGANGVDKSKLTSLKDRVVYIWPDNDMPGQQYADQLKKLLLKQVSQLFIFDTKKYNKGHTKGYDGYDFLKEHSVEDVYALLNQFDCVIKEKSQPKKDRQRLQDDLKSLIWGGNRIIEKESLYVNNKLLHFYSKVRESKKINDIYNSMLFQVNDEKWKRAIVLDITHSHYGAAKYKSVYMQCLASMPEPNFIIRDNMGKQSQYIYLLEEPIDASDEQQSAYFNEVAKKVALLAGSCREFKGKFIPKAIPNTNGLIYNPLTQQHRQLHKDTFTLDELNECFECKETIFFRKENKQFFDMMRDIAYRAVNYATDLKACLFDLAEQAQKALKIQLFPKEIALVIKSVVDFTIKNKDSFTYRRTILSRLDEVTFSTLSSYERKLEGASYTALLKRNRMIRKLMLIIAKQKQLFTQKEIAKLLGISSSNISQHYKSLYQQLVSAKIQQLNLQQCLNSHQGTSEPLIPYEFKVYNMILSVQENLLKTLKKLAKT